MSPAWARRNGWSLYFYASEPHLEPHIALRGPGYRATLRLADGALLAGHAPPAVLRECRRLLREHAAIAEEAFLRTVAHDFPGTLEETLALKENDDER